MPLAYIALGANLPSPAGPPLLTLRRAAEHLGGLGQITAASSLYHTDPVGLLDQPRFLNAVVAIRTELPPAPLLDHLLHIEHLFGRDRSNSQANGPRTLDLDLLLLDNVVISTPALTLPHAQLHLRRFVLAPLAEIAPDLVHPVLHTTIAALLAQLPTSGNNASTAVRRSTETLH